LRIYEAAKQINILIHNIYEVLLSMYIHLSKDVDATIGRDEQLKLVLKNGCTNYQGNLYGRPEPIEQSEVLLKQG
jgi:EAL domain-containing protein (putative c-di-GMP-specific phosphodiesterase class I)